MLPVGSENQTTSLRSWKCTPFGAFGTTFPPEGGTGPMDLSLSDKAIFKNTSQENLHHVLLSDHRTFAIA